MKETITKLEYIKFGDWYTVRDTAMDLINRNSNRDPSPVWKRKMLMAERSPLRKMYVSFKFKVMPRQTVEYFARNFPRIQWYISGSNRESLKETDDAYQDDEYIPVEGLCSALDLIEVSKKALCHHTPEDVREYWVALRTEIKQYQPELAEVMVHECVYRGFCPEFQCCGYVHSSTFRSYRREYVKGFKGRTDGQTVDAVTGEIHNDYVLEEKNGSSKRLHRKHKSQISQSNGTED